MSDNEKMTDEHLSGAEQKTAGNEEKMKLPKVDFSTVVLSLAASALTSLGEVPHPDTGEHAVDLELARHNIDVLEMIQDKIKNGLTPEETRLLEGVLYELHMKYVIKSS